MATAKNLLKSARSALIKWANFVYFPLRTRGLILLCLVLYLLIWPAKQEQDIVATVFAFALLALLAFCTLLTLFSTAWLKRNLAFEVLPPAAQASHGMLTSQTALPFTVRSIPLRILPFFVLRLKIRVGPEDSSKLSQAAISNKYDFGAKTIKHELFGAAQSARVLCSEITFPHRGEWKICGIDVEFGDQLGIAAQIWSITGDKVEQALRLAPIPAPETTIPALTSAERTGDAQISITDKKGDPFDLKPYHPADGAKRIAWKIYARSGELFSRQFEPSMIPEGKVVTYLDARREDDRLCATLAAYLEKLEFYDLEVFAAVTGSEAIARSSKAALELFIDSAWDCPTAQDGVSSSDCLKYISSCQALCGQSRIKYLLIFVAESRFEDSHVVASFMHLGEELERQGTSPIFVLLQAAGPSLGSDIEMWLPIKRFFVFEQGDRTQPQSKLWQEFAVLCAKRQWEVILSA